MLLLIFQYQQTISRHTRNTTRTMTKKIAIVPMMLPEFPMVVFSNACPSLSSLCVNQRDATVKNQKDQQNCARRLCSIADMVGKARRQ